MTWAKGAIFGAVVAAVLVAAACSDEGGLTCEEAAQMGRPCDAAGGAGASGAGTGGVSGSGGSGGAPMMGQGGGGSGGGRPCSDDPDCKAAVGEGSLCVNQVCTAPTEGEACKRVTVVVVDKAFAGSLEGAPVDACYFRSLDEGLTAVSPGTTTRLAVYADTASSANPIQLVAGVTLEGHGAQGPMTELGAGAGGPALVTLGEGSGIKGFKLDGKAGKAVVALSGTVTLAGPLELHNGAPALSVEGNATAKVTGTEALPVLFSANARGVYVGGTAGLEVTGVGGQSVVVEGTTGGAGVLVEAGVLSKGELKMTGVLVRENKSGSGVNGEGGLQIRDGRKASVETNTFSNNSLGASFQGTGINATVSTNTFSNNDISMAFDPKGSTSPSAFDGITLVTNDFEFALATSGQGVAICGQSLGADGTKLKLGDGNKFPSNRVSSEATCPQLQGDQEGACAGGRDIDYSGTSNSFILDCTP